MGRSQIFLVSPDTKKVAIEKSFKEISFCSQVWSLQSYYYSSVTTFFFFLNPLFVCFQGIRHVDHFGFICRETVEGGNCHFVCYVFQCTDESLVRHEVDKDSCLCPDTVHSIFPCNRLQITESQLRFWTLAQCHFVLLSPAVEFLQQKWCSYIFFQFWICAEKENFTHWFFLISVPPTQCFDLLSLLHLRVNKFALDLKWNARRQEGEISHKCFLFFCHFRLNISVNHRTYDSVHLGSTDS